MEELIRRALPGVDNDVIKKVADRLKELGMLFEDDGQYVEESYLVDILKPIQLKKLLAFFSGKTSTNIPGVILVDHVTKVGVDENAPVIENVYSTSSVPIITKHWFEDFNVPWALFSKEVLEACKNGRRLEKPAYLEMIRILASYISEIDPSPRRKQLRVIAKKIASTFPETFEDRCDDTRVGNGYTTLLRKIENSLENRRRKRNFPEKFGVNEATFKKSTKNSYGCSNWQPIALPLGETMSSQLGHKNWLIAESKKLNRDENKIAELMLMTYASQRCAINCKKSLREISEEWPILLEDHYFMKHAEILLNKVNCADRIIENMNIKGKVIYDFMSSKPKNKYLFRCLKNIQAAKEKLNNITPETLGAIPLVMAYFSEEEEELFQINKDPISKEELENNPNRLTPFIATSGGDIYTADDFCIVIDGVLIMRVNSYLLSVVLMFLSYYVFNIEYPEKASLTLEFIQRILADINPQRGTKAARVEGKKQKAVAAPVVNLGNELRSFELISCSKEKKEQ